MAVKQGQRISATLLCVPYLHYKEDLMNALTRHAAQRLSQRNILPEELEFVLRYGRRTYRTGVRFVFLGKRDLPRGYERSHGHLVGVTVLQAPDQGWVITAYRNTGASREIKRLPKNPWGYRCRAASAFVERSRAAHVPVPALTR